MLQQKTQKHKIVKTKTIQGNGMGNGFAGCSRVAQNVRNEFIGK